MILVEFALRGTLRRSFWRSPSKNPFLFDKVRGIAVQTAHPSHFCLIGVVCLFGCLFICVFACLLACLLVCLFVCLFVCFVSLFLFVCLFVCLFDCLFVCLFVCLFRVCVCVFVSGRVCLCL